MAWSVTPTFAVHVHPTLPGAKQPLLTDLLTLWTRGHKPRVYELTCVLIRRVLPYTATILIGGSQM
jgi:hypothetical protein